MRQVLIPSDGSDVVRCLADGYARLGCNVLVGRSNFDWELCQTDVVHFMWPEEFTAWRVPRESEITAIERKLDRWARRSRFILTVHNLYPHRHHGNPLFHRLFSAFYAKAEVIHHTSEVSRKLVCEHFPNIADRNHLVRLGYNYDRLLPPNPANRAESRARFGFQSEHLVYLLLGALRTWEEAQLVRRAFAKARVPNKRLLISSRLQEDAPRWKRVWHRWNFDRWTRSAGIRRIAEYVPDEELPHLLSAADIVVVARQNSMGSGVPSLAMTFSRMLICPDSGAIPEFVGGAANELYHPSSAESLAAAMERAAAANHEKIGTQNRAIAAGWSWEEIARACLDALPPLRGPSN